MSNPRINSAHMKRILDALNNYAWDTANREMEKLDERFRLPWDAPADILDIQQMPSGKQFLIDGGYAGEPVPARLAHHSIWLNASSDAPCSIERSTNECLRKGSQNIKGSFIVLMAFLLHLAFSEFAYSQELQVVPPSYALRHSYIFVNITKESIKYTSVGDHEMIAKIIYGELSDFSCQIKAEKESLVSCTSKYAQIPHKMYPALILQYEITTLPPPEPGIYGDNWKVRICVMNDCRKARSIEDYSIPLFQTEIDYARRNCTSESKVVFPVWTPEVARLAYVFCDWKLTSFILRKF